MFFLMTKVFILYSTRATSLIAGNDQRGNQWPKQQINLSLHSPRLILPTLSLSFHPTVCQGGFLDGPLLTTLSDKGILAGQERSLVLLTSSTITSCNQMRKQRRECKGCYLQRSSTRVQLLGWTVCKTLLWNNALYKYPVKRILNRYLISSVIWEGWANTAGLLMWAERFNMRHRKPLISTSSFPSVTYIFILNTEYIHQDYLYMSKRNSHDVQSQHK